MTDIDPKALERACQCANRSLHHFDRMAMDLPLRVSIIAHAHTIEHHEQFRRDVSEALEAYQKADSFEDRCNTWNALLRFILPEPVDPLVEAMSEAMYGIPGEDYHAPAQALRTALAKYGLQIVKTSHDA